MACSAVECCAVGCTDVKCVGVGYTVVVGAERMGSSRVWARKVG